MDKSTDRGDIGITVAILAVAAFLIYFFAISSGYGI